MATASSRLTEVTAQARSAWRDTALWLLATAAVTALLLLLRSTVDRTHFALAYLLLVLAASSRAGRTVGLTIAVLCFLCFNFFLLPPYYTFSLHDTLDWFVLAAFLVTATVSAELLSRAQRQTRAAERRAEEIDRLSTVGAETLNAGHAEAAAYAIVAVIRATLDLASCEIHAPADGSFRCIAAAARPGHNTRAHTPVDDMFPFVLAHGAVALQRADGTFAVDTRPGVTPAEVFLAHPEATAFLLPLRVRGNVVGLLRLEHEVPIRFDEAGSRFVDVLSYYAALGAERVRLTAEAERALALAEADRLKDMVIAAVSHDLRTPLTTIRALAFELAGEGDERALAIYEETDRLNRFVADLLDLSRLNSGGMPLKIEVNPVDDLVSAAVQQTAGVLNTHELRAKLPDGDIVVGRFDPVAALRALVNLIENAAKYSPPGAPIDLTVERSGDWLELFVEDRGPGVPAEQADRMFEPFVRVGAARDDGGSGLGLSIARRLADTQGGSLEYRPRAGGGSTFVLRLPAASLPDDLTA